MFTQAISNKKGALVGLSLFFGIFLGLFVCADLSATPGGTEYLYWVTPDGGSRRTQSRTVVCSANGEIFSRATSGPNEGFMEVRANGDGAFWQHLTWDDGWVKIRRSGNVVETTGEIDGKAIRHRDQIDSRPWYPDFNLLSDFALSDEPERGFYLLLPAGPRVLKMVATREGREVITIDGRSIATIRLRVRAEGLFGLFWNQPFWFRADDGLLVRYRSREGPPTDPEVLVELVEERPAL